MMTMRRHKITEPLETVTAVFGGLLLALVAVGVAFTVFGSGSFLGFGNQPICVTQPGTTYDDSQWAAPAGAAARPGASLSVTGALQACAAHPGTGQRILYTLTTLPGLLVWAGVLFLLWRLIRTAGEAGPFTVPVAATLWRLGWLIIAGTAIATAIQALALSVLLHTMLTAPDWSPGPSVALAVIRAVLPIPALVAAALLSFARIILVGADMDDEIKATV